MKHYTRDLRGRFASKPSMSPAHGPRNNTLGALSAIDLVFDSIVGLSLLGMSLALAIFATGAVL